MLDYVLSIFLVVSPFLLGFNDDDTASACFVVLGLLGLVLTIATRYLPASRAPRTAAEPPTRTASPGSEGAGAVQHLRACSASIGRPKR